MNLRRRPRTDGARRARARGSRPAHGRRHARGGRGRHPPRRLSGLPRGARPVAPDRRAGSPWPARRRDRRLSATEDVDAGEAVFETPELPPTLRERTLAYVREFGVVRPVITLGEAAAMVDTASAPAAISAFRTGHAARPLGGRARSPLVAPCRLGGLTRRGHRHLGRRDLPRRQRRSQRRYGRPQPSRRLVDRCRPSPGRP